MQLTKAEESIIQTIAEREGIAAAVMEATYRYYQQTGIPPHQNAPQWMKDIYREAQDWPTFSRIGAHGGKTSGTASQVSLVGIGEKMCRRSLRHESNVKRHYRKAS